MVTSSSVGSTLDLLRHVACVLIITLLVSSQGGVAEFLYHLRGIRDPPSRPADPREISGKEEAKIYLQKYGYLHCGGGRQKRDVSLREGSSNTEDDDCTDEEVKEALLKLQETFKLNPSGELDEATRKTMSEGRCGNTDSEVHEQDGVEKQRPREPPVVSPGLAKLAAAAPIVPIHEADGVTPSTQLPSRHRRSLSQQRNHKSLLSRILRPNPIVTEAHVSTPHRQFTDKEIIREMKEQEAKNKLMKSKRRSTLFLDLIDYNRRRLKRRKRSAAENFGRQFHTDLITWQLPSFFFSESMPESEQKLLVTKAFRFWSEVSPPKFRESSQADIIVAFGKRNHGCNKIFDGRGGELAHSWGGGDMHFDDEEDYKAQLLRFMSNGVNFLKVAVHEVGHVLGLAHTESSNSIMYPLFQSVSSDDQFELTYDDRRNIQAVYGKCKGQFDIVIDWLRREQPFDQANPRYMYNTYFFRDDHYWMYENRFARPRYGDPNHITTHWRGLPTNMDAYVQITQLSGYYYNIETYFFHGEYFYRYDDDNDQVATGYPKKISQFLGPKDSTQVSIPDNLDAAYYHATSNTIYFFKDQWVWLYPVGASGLSDNACCTRQVLFDDLFVEQEVTNRVTGYIDSVYHSFRRPAAYIFKGEKVYQMIASTNGTFKLVEVGNWYDYWYDLCDVA